MNPICYVNMNGKFSGGDFGSHLLQVNPYLRHTLSTGLRLSYVAEALQGIKQTTENLRQQINDANTKLTIPLLSIDLG